MARKPGTLETLQFALELLKRIPRHGKISASDLHRQMTEAGWQRDLRTVQRQLDELSQNFDIDRDDRERPYGYRWKQQARGLSLPGLNEKEALLLALAEQHLANLLPAQVMKSMRPFFQQANATLAADSEGPRTARQWMDKVRVVSVNQPLLAPDLEASVFDAVSAALYGNFWLDVEYRNSASRTVSASVMPLGLAQQGTRLYLVCRFRGFDDNRSLALHRIRRAQASTLRFKPPANFDLQTFDDEGRFAFGEGRRIKLRMRIAKGAGLHLLESRLSKDQTVIERDDCYEIVATVTDSAQLKWWLRGFGDEVEVLAPKHLRESLWR